MHLEAMRIFNFCDFFLLIHLYPTLIGTFAYLFLSFFVTVTVVLPDLVIYPSE